MIGRVFYDVYFLYGNTCSGKDTIGVALEKKDGLTYISFGKLKRKEILSQTEIGILLEKQIKQGQPISPEIGAELIVKFLALGSNIIAGFPISGEEMETLKESLNSLSDWTIKGVVILEIDESLISERFFNRRVCPVCQFPGREGNICPTHNVPLIKRFDCNEEELVFRLALYSNRIKPFLESGVLGEYPQIVIDISKLSKTEMVKKIRSFIQKTNRKEEKDDK